LEPESALNEVLILRAIFTWVATNVEYDLEQAYGSGADLAAACTPDAVLKSRRSVCSGYARLFQSLCQEAGLVVDAVSGCSKGLSFTVGDALLPDSEPDHEWNVVTLTRSGTRRRILCDTTWAGGAVVEGKYVKRFNEFYWNTDPQRYIFSHFPTDPDSQLLERPLSLAQFGDLVHLKSAFFHNGLHVVSHKQARVDCSKEKGATGGGLDDVCVIIEGPLDVLLIATVHPRKDKASPEEGRTLVHSHLDPDPAKPLDRKRIFQVLVRPPDASATNQPSNGESQEPVLSLFVRRNVGGNIVGGTQYDWAADYLLSPLPNLSAPPRALFPKTWGAFTSCHAVLVEPRTRTVPCGKATTFKIAVPGAEKVYLFPTANSRDARELSRVPNPGHKGTGSQESWLFALTDMVLNDPSADVALAAKIQSSQHTNAEGTGQQVRLQTLVTFEAAAAER